MELSFKDYYEEGLKGAAWGAGAGYLAGSLLGGPLGGYAGAALGGWLGHKAQQPHATPYTNKSWGWGNSDSQHFVYYRDADGHVVKELLPNRYYNLDDEREKLNADPHHPYYYFFKCSSLDCEKGKIVQRVKAGYQSYQRKIRYNRGH